MVDRLKLFLAVHKVTVILIASLVLIISGGFIALQKFTAQETILEEADLFFDAEGPYALLYPRRDGNAMVLNLKRTASYDVITYELVYTSKKEEAAEISGKILEEGESSGGVVDRGVVGTIDTKERKGEYEQEILFGTCSKNVCKYDKGVENGTLTLHIRKGNKQSFSSNKAFRMITQWHLQKPDVALGQLTSGDEHFHYKVDASREELALVGYSIINDLTGVPKLSQGKEVLGKVYALNVPITKELPGGDVSLELAQNPPDEAKLARFDEGENRWVELDTKVEGSKLFSEASGGGIFAVLISKK